MPKNAVFPEVSHQPLAFSYVETVMDMQKLSFEELMVLGKPGAGKTTFLKHLVLQATNGKINKIPIFVSLKRGQTLITY
jgi:predicted NACHT family NTPase